MVARAGLGAHFSVECVSALRFFLGQRREVDRVTVTHHHRVAQRVIDEAKALLEKRAAEMRASAEDLVRAAAALDSL